MNATSVFDIKGKETKTQSPKSRKSKDCNRDVNTAVGTLGKRGPP